MRAAPGNRQAIAVAVAAAVLVAGFLQPVGAWAQEGDGGSQTSAPVDSVSTAEPSESGDTTEPAAAPDPEASDPAEPTESPATDQQPDPDAGEPSEEAEPDDGAEQIEPTDTAEATEPAEPTNSDEPTESAESPESPESLDRSTAVATPQAAKARVTLHPGSRRTYPGHALSLSVSVKTSAPVSASTFGRVKVTVGGRTIATKAKVVNKKVVVTIPGSVFRGEKTYSARVYYQGSSTTYPVGLTVAIKSAYTGSSLETVRKRTGSASLGSKVSGVHRSSSKVRFQYFGRAALVEVIKGKNRTVISVRGDLYRKYRSLKGPKGQMGFPLGSSRKNLPAGPLQRFSNGVLLATGSGVQVTMGKGSFTPMNAVTRSQVGQVFDMGVTNKYQSFNGADGNAAWCAMFLSWAGYASGNGDQIPRAASFAEFKQILLNRGVRTDFSNLRVGDIVIVNGGISPESHAGVVTSTTSGSVTVNEGNVFLSATKRLVRSGTSYPYSSMSYFYRPTYR